MFKLNNEQNQILETVRRITREKIKPVASEIDDTGEFPVQLVELFAENGILAPLVPEEYGGIGADYLLFSMIIEEVAKVSAAAALILISQADGIAPIMHLGNNEQKKKYLPMAVQGKIACFAATEPDAGSDIQAMKTRAIRNERKYTINGQKCFITNGSVADFMTLFTYTDPGKNSRGITVFVADKGTKGIIYGKNEKKMGMKGCVNTQLFFEDLTISLENRLGEEGEGFLCMMKAFEIGRVLTASQAVGLAQGAIDEAVNYTKQRIQFGKPIATLQTIQFMIADMVAGTEASRLLTYQAATDLDKNDKKRIPISCSIAKFMASDNAMKVTTDAVQVFGGYGYMKDYPVERMMRDAKLIQIYTGTNQIMRLVTAREIFK
ncbi:MAG: acyl-CoA dehydrogenase family protein [Desulfobacteraceae bacterium]|jgi:alkylation response protein AidB-like acyl-CoA dehydrogenase